MKEYGIDLRKQYLKVNELKAQLEGKIQKRYDFLLQNTPKEILQKVNLPLLSNNSPINDKLNDIITIEKAYVEQSNQLNMFKH